MTTEQVSKNLCKEAVRWVGSLGIIKNLFEVKHTNIQLGEQPYLILVIGVDDGFTTFAQNTSCLLQYRLQIWPCGLAKSKKHHFDDLTAI